MLNSGHIKKAYLYLKSYAYHENINLFLKQRIADFEINNKNIETIFDDVLSIINCQDFDKDDDFNKLLNRIDYHLLPKKIERQEEKIQKKYNNSGKGLFISNVRASDQYQVSKVNYFICAPIEIHILEIIWCLFAGPALEAVISKDNYGNRMHPSALKYGNNPEGVTGQELFKRYIEQYNAWRDQAIQEATETAHSDDDVALFSMDLKSYFYEIDLNFEKIRGVIKNYYSDNIEQLNIALKLNFLLEKIYLAYQERINDQIKRTHVSCKNKHIIPIGFASSAIIANWYLLEFDNYIEESVRPLYYGRYVDDILMVFKRPNIDLESPIESFIENYFSGLIYQCDDKLNYEIRIDNNKLPIQKDKLILQFFDKKHSRAGLYLFKQELDERSSAFKFLPNDHIDKDLDKFAYDILYNGPANTLRSVIGLAENETELSKYLSSHITAHRLCHINKKDNVLPQLKQFFRGQNALQFFRLWEKLYQYGVITNQSNSLKLFKEYIDSEIIKIEGVMPKSKRISLNFTKKIHKDLKIFSELSLSITLGLLDLREYPESLWDLSGGQSAFFNKKIHINGLIDYGSNLHKYAWQFRQSNLIRHHLVAWPLANFCNYDGDLTCETKFLNFENPKLDEKKLAFSPRFIHFDEWQLFHLGEELTKTPNLNTWMESCIDEYKSRNFGQDFSIKLLVENNENTNIIKSKLKVDGYDKKEILTLAIANLKISENDIASAIRKDCKPNLSFDRQQKLFDILNSALREHADLLIMPEVAIPVSWLPFMVAFVRRHQIGLVFGLEHWVVNDTAYNLIIEALPFKVSGEYKSCVVTARIKNHYAPSELEMLQTLRLKPGHLEIKPNIYYHKVSWRGISFATYNCFELSDITHRVLFKSEIDLLIACVWNRDTNYYHHILESAVRDLHCYTVQANTSHYGGSCVLRPMKTDSKTMLYVKGGENSCVLTTRLSIKALRDFQFKSIPNSSDSFKHLPPGYDCEAVLDR
ncbi:hypothetical protein QLG01_00545 [Acinetobacter sp. V89_4]|uniref:hypothetical protein n=1 Tax=Acinetobacter sp. V89_4 TaxID=3044232 RepID=UPI00249E35D1|nr:hypothetical protein [Acinetobacter sp. V89_4]MDI3451683.1 hypothetical protein [Acinetobacter sp. V89_4]